MYNSKIELLTSKLCSSIKDDRSNYSHSLSGELCLLYIFEGHFRRLQQRSCLMRLRTIFLHCNMNSLLQQNDCKMQHCLQSTYNPFLLSQNGLFFHITGLCAKAKTKLNGFVWNGSWIFVWDFRRNNRYGIQIQKLISENPLYNVTYMGTICKQLILVDEWWRTFDSFYFEKPWFTSLS